MSESNCPNRTLISLKPMLADNVFLSPNFYLKRGIWSPKLEVSNFEPLNPLNKFTFFVLGSIFVYLSLEKFIQTLQMNYF